jgi:choline dehydrogenase-like flavoprotein
VHLQADRSAAAGAMVSSSSKKKKKVCVVGGGVAGLASARELRREGHHVTVMEQSAGVGGQWLYDTRTDGGDPLGTAGAHSSIYASLRLNTPTEVVGFSDFPFHPKSDGGGDARLYPCVPRRVPQVHHHGLLRRVPAHGRRQAQHQGPARRPGAARRRRRRRHAVGGEVRCQ